MFPNWLYETVVGSFYKNFGAIGLEWADNMVLQYIKDVLKGIITVILMIVWGTVFIYDYISGNIPTPANSMVTVNKGTPFFKTNNRTITFTNNYDIPVLLDKLNVEIRECSDQNVKDAYDCKFVSRYQNDFYNYPKKGIVIEPHSTKTLTVTFNDSFLRNYDFVGYEKDIVEFNTNTIPLK